MITEFFELHPEYEKILNESYRYFEKVIRLKKDMLQVYRGMAEVSLLLHQGLMENNLLQEMIKFFINILRLLI